MEDERSIKPVGLPLVSAFKYIASVALLPLVAGCMSFGVFNHDHSKQPVDVVIFSGLESYADTSYSSTLNLDGPTKAFHEPRFIVLGGVAGRKVTWTFKGEPGDTARFRGLTFMEEVDSVIMDGDDPVPFTGSFSLAAGDSKTLKLGPGPHPPVYELRIWINDRPINYPVKVIP